jgi:hypothetical protein
MSTSGPIPGDLRGDSDVEALRRLYEHKARAELAEADSLAPGSDIVPSAGALLAQVALVKGLPGPAEVSGGAALSGADGRAAASALAALGYAPGSTFAVVSRTEVGTAPEARAERLRLTLEAVDPRLIVALDQEAAEDVSQAFGIAPLRFGRPVRVLGRTIVAVDGLEASLNDPSRKRRVWRQWKAVDKPRGGS